MKQIANFFLGRTTLFCCGFFFAGNIMHALNKLDATYISYMVALMGFVLGHSYKCDVTAKQSES